MKVRVPMLGVMLLLGCSETGLSDADEPPEPTPPPVETDDDDAVDDDDVVEDRCTDELEPNDDLENAFGIHSQSYPGLRACPDDEDWYALYMEAFDVLTANLYFTDGTSGGDVDLFLYGPDGLVLDSSALVNEDEALQATALESGLHYVVVAPAGELVADGVEYMLDVGHAPVDVCLDDPREPNDDLQHASHIHPNLWWNYFVCPISPDWFETTRFAGERLEIWLRHDPAEGDLDLAFYDWDGNMLAESRTQSDEEYVVWEFPAFPEEGAYGIEVVTAIERGEYYGNVYDLEIRQTWADGCPTDVFEYNDRQDWSSPVIQELYPNLHACATDTDWYKSYSDAGAELEITVDWDAAEGALDMTLYDRWGLEIGSVATSEGEAVGTYTVPAYEAYFAKVQLAADAGPGLGVPYSLTWGGASTVQCWPDIQEPNDQEQEAIGVATGPYVDLNICPTDDDWYSRLLWIGETLTVDVSFDPADGDIDVYLLHPDGTVLDAAETDGPLETVSWTSDELGFYFVQLVLKADPGGQEGADYEMVVSYP